MRSSKYHDYRVLKIALFIILVVLGLFIYIKCIRAPLEHTAPDNAWKVLTEATCTTDGQRCKVCTECGEEFAHEAIPATDHDLYWKTGKEPTCTSDGVKIKICRNCEETFDTDEIKATGHTIADEWTISKKATCTDEGSKYKACKDCDAELERETIPATGHTPKANPVVLNYVAPTCTVGGSQVNVYFCKTCSKEAFRETVAAGDPLGHSYTWEIKYNEATDAYEMVGNCDCDEDGNVIVLDADDGLTLTLDESVPICQIKRYYATVTYEGDEIIKVVEVDPEPHAIYAVDNDGVITYIPMDESVAGVDYMLGRYFAYDESIMHIVEGDNFDDGFAKCVVKCLRCGEWQAVMAYKATSLEATLPPNTEDEE